MVLNYSIPVEDWQLLHSREVGKITRELGSWGKANAIRWEINSKTEEKSPRRKETS